MNDAHYIRRCFDLARLGAGRVSPNPMVGAVLVFNDHIIGEGWHQRWGEAHAEVNCIQSVSPQNLSLLPHSTLYCNLEPCSHHGKTPPCVDLILKHAISRVVVSNVDPNPLVAGKGIAALKNAGVATTNGVLEAEGHWLNRSFFTQIAQKRPYIILKWAQSADGFMGLIGERSPISGPATQRLVHRWRAECDAIMVGTTTALLDNPRLDVRHFFGKNPLRVAIDTQGKIPTSHHLLDGSTATWIFGEIGNEVTLPPLISIIPAAGVVPIQRILEALHTANKASLLVEGGAKLLFQFIAQDLWDEIRVIENTRRLGEGVAAPTLPKAVGLKEQFVVANDTLRIFAR